MILEWFRLDERVAVVTGAGRGLGAAIAEGFAEAGANVVIAARTRSQLDDVAARIAATGQQAHVVETDLSDPDATAALVNEAVNVFGRLDIVVNNVGGAMPKPLLDTSVADIDRALRFNVSTAHALATAAAPAMAAAEHGAIINITSAMGWAAGRGYAAYGTAKGALAHYTELIAQDLAPRVRVNAIAPGSIHTSALDTVAENDELRRPMEQATPLRRLGTPADVAAAAVYLASDAASYVTGKILEVDGGLTAPNMELGIPDVTGDSAPAG